MYKYKMVQVPPNIAVNMKDSSGNDAADYLEEVVNHFAEKGWEFHRIDTIGVQVRPGCWAALFGQKAQTNSYYVISFRREA